MFNDARKPQAGMLIDANPFAGLGLEQSKGRKHVQPPAPGEVARLIAAADDLTPPSFAAYLFTACYSAMRPGELDALNWTDLDFTPGAETIRIERQWNVKARKLTDAQAWLAGVIAMVEPLRDRLLDLPRESEWVFTTLRGHHYTPSTRAPIGTASAARSGSARRRSTRRRATTSLGTCSTSRAPDHVVACSCATTTAERSSASYTAIPDAAMARERIRAAFRDDAPVVALPAESRNESRPAASQVKLKPNLSCSRHCAPPSGGAPSA